MTELTSKLEVLAQARGKEKLSEATRKHIRRKIEAEFGSILLIFPYDKGKLIVVPENLSVEDIVKMNLAMKKELDILKHHSSDKSILDMKWKSLWPIHPCDVDIRSFAVPESLRRLLMSVLTADASNPSQRIMNLVCSFSQDIIYAVTCGKTKPPKQVLLSYGVKTLTGNVELLQILNRFGHGISYHHLEENDTALCLEKIVSNLNQSPIIPKAIQAKLFTSLAWDNIDRLEETLTGEGTTHRVNGIIVQP